MVQASDLRLGNWVSAENQIGCVSKIGAERIELVTTINNTHQHLETDYDKITPIQLTPSLLAQCGFYRHELFPHRNAFHHHRLIFNLNFVGNTCEVSYGLIEDNIAIIYQRPLFLHQLQNLYYLLTNQELKPAL